MAQFYGEIGFADTVETTPGVWEDVIIEKKFRGDVPRNAARSSSGDNVIPDPSLGSRVRLVGTKFAFANAKKMRYIRFEGELWTIENIEINRPRLEIGMGEIYDGPTAPTPDNP